MIPKEKNNDKARFGTFGNLITVILILLVLYVVYHVILGFGESVSTTPAGLVSDTREIVLEGIVFRDEKVVYSGNGAIFPVVCEGELASVGSEIARVYPRVGNSDVMHRINELENNLSILKKSKMTGMVSAIEIAELEREVDSLYSELMRVISLGETHKISSLEDRILIAQNKLKICKGEVGSFNSQIAQIENELKSMYASYKGEAEYIFAEQSGYLYYSADGYEKEFTLEALENITPNEIEKYLAWVKKKPNASNESAIKLVLGHTWYIAVACDLDTATMLSVGEKYQVTLFDYMPRELSVTLEKIGETQGNSVVLTFSSTTLPTDFDYTRYQELRLDIRGFEGYRVPREALCKNTDENGNVSAGVFVLDASVVRYKKVEIIAEEGGYYIVSKSDDDEFLNLNDLIITDPRGMYDGKVLSR